MIRSTSRSSDTAHIAGGSDVTSRLPQLRRVLTGRKSAGFACDQVVAREFHDVRGRLSVAQHERPAALNRRSMVSWQASAQQGPAFVIGDDLCGQTVVSEPGNREVGAAVGRRPSGGSRVVAAGRCGPAASHSSRSGWVTLARAMSRSCAARSGNRRRTLSRSCAYLRTLLVTGPWRSAGDPARRNSAAASRGLRIYVEFGISRLMPTTGLCRPWRGAHPFGLPAARARLCRAVSRPHVAQTGRFIAHPAHRV